MPVDPVAGGELAWRCWIAGGRAVTSATVAVVADTAELPLEARAWKASLGRLLEAESLVRTPEGSAAGAPNDPALLAKRLFRSSGLSGADLASALELRVNIQTARKLADRELTRALLLVDRWDEKQGGARRHADRVPLLGCDRHLHGRTGHPLDRTRPRAQ